MHCNIQIRYTLTFLVLIHCLYVNGQQNEGDDCNLSDIPGICVPKTNKEVEVGKRAKEKCMEYSSYIYEWELPENETDPEKKVRVDRCGHAESPLVIGHDIASSREYPHMAILGWKRENNTLEWMYAATLICEQFVMTSAHCTYSGDGELRWVRLAEYSIEDIINESKALEFSIDEIIRHPDYKPPSLYNDIALLKLDRRVVLNKFVIPACLHTKFEVQEKNAATAGWGQNRFPEYIWEIVLKMDISKVVLEIFTPEACNSTYADEGEDRLKFGITESMICAGLRTPGGGTCHEASGGPLQIYRKTPYCMYDVIGISSFGKLCTKPGVPEINTRVSHYVEWIESVVWPE